MDLCSLFLPRDQRDLVAGFLPMINIFFLQGTVLGKIEFDDQPIEFVDPNLRNLAEEASVKEVKVYGQGNPYKIVCIDAGIKHHIIRCLLQVRGRTLCCM